jgi:acetyltransferase-like isoleucine patch superfamily enzyme
MTRFPDWQRPKFDKNNMTKWSWLCQYHENLEIGDQTDIGAFTYINAKNKVEIGEEVQIGSHCSIYTVNTIDGTEGKVLIGKGARIGSHTIILPGVVIGENSVVGAHSLVKDDVPAGQIYGGVPARKIK